MPDVFLNDSSREYIRSLSMGQVVAMKTFTKRVEKLIKQVIGIQGTSSDRSSAGSPLRRQTGLLQRNVKSAVIPHGDTADGVVYVDTPKVRNPGDKDSTRSYAIQLEEGTQNMAPRPYFYPTIRRVIAKMATNKVTFHTYFPLTYYLNKSNMKPVVGVGRDT